MQKVSFMAFMGEEEMSCSNHCFHKTIRWTWEQRKKHGSFFPLDTIPEEAEYISICCFCGEQFNQPKGKVNE